MLSEHRGWLVYVDRSPWDADGKQRVLYSAKRTSELKRKFMRPPYVPVPEFETVEELHEWIDETAPYKI